MRFGLEQIANVKLYLFGFAKLAEQLQVQNLYKIRKSSKNRSSNFDLMKEIMDLSRIILAIVIVEVSCFYNQTFGHMDCE